jgi:hypothetical protein
MAGKPKTPPPLDVEVTEDHRFEARLKVMDDVTVIFLAMGMLEPLKRVDEKLAAKARTVFAEVLDRWVPDEIGGAGAAFMIGENQAKVPMPDEEAVEEFAYLLAVRDQYPDLMREALADMEGES